MTIRKTKSMLCFFFNNKIQILFYTNLNLYKTHNVRLRIFMVVNRTFDLP